MLEGQRLLEAAEHRWELAVASRPELEAGVDVQRRLVSRGLELGEAVGRRMPARALIDRAEIAIKLREGRPVLVGSVIEVTGEPLLPFILGFCEDLSTGEAGEPAGRLRQRLGHREIDAGSLIAASLGRQQEAIRTKAHHVGVSPDLLWLVAELAAGPIAHRLQHDLLRVDDATRRLVADWDHGFCPACGSWPAFAERVGQDGGSDRRADFSREVPGRSLRCSFCGVAWAPPTWRCIYCEDVTEPLVTAAPDAGDNARRVEMCRQCGGYLKSLGVEAATPFALLAVADLETSDLDLGALDRGYGRPPMRDFPTAGSVPCPPIIET